MRYPELIDKYDVTNVKNNIPSVISARHVGGDGSLSHKKDWIVRYHEQGPCDFLNFIPDKSDCLTQTGLKLLQESIESYVYCVLGIQADTRFSIIVKGGSSLQTQSVFRRLIEDTIIQNNPTKLIRNMKVAIKDTNTILNLAISPGLLLVPSRMIILKEKIVGYNNILTSANNKNMTFGVSAKLNYVGVKKEEPKKVSQPNSGVASGPAFPAQQD